MISVLASLLGGQSAPIKYTLTWQPKIGEYRRYRLSMDLTLEDNPVNIEADIFQRVRKKDKETRFEISSETRNLRIISENSVQRMPDEPAVIDIVNASGDRIDKVADDSEDSFSRILTQATDFHPPANAVAIGAKWSKFSNVRASDREKFRIEFCLSAIDRRGHTSLLHVKFAGHSGTGRESVHSDGYFLIDPRNYWIVASEATIHNARVIPGLESGDVVVRLRQVP